MSWISIRTTKGLWKVKPRWQMRWAERHRKVRVFDLGLIVIIWWSNKDLESL